MADESYVVYTDSCADLSKDLVEEADIHECELSFLLEGKSYLNYYDQREISTHEFFEKMRNGEVVKTSQVSPGQFLEAWDPVLKSGKDILYIAFASALSGTINSAREAKEYLNQNYPERTIEIVDSKSASTGQGFLVYEAGKNRLNGMSLKENKEWIETRRLHLAHWFTIDDLNILKRGGRLSASKAFLGTMFRLKPVLHVDNDGKLVPMQTVRGRKQSLMAMIQRFADTAIEPEKNPVMIVQADDMITAKWLGDKLKQDYHVPKVFYCDLGPVIGAHCGGNTIGLFFWATER